MMITLWFPVRKHWHTVWQKQRVFRLFLKFQPDFSHQVAGSYGLSKALDMAADVNPRPNMQRVMLYITPLPANNELSALSEMTSRAVQLNVHVFVWLVTYTNYANDKGALALQDLAARTGGQYFLFSGPEKLPDIESYFSPLRGLYNVSYTSVINTSGTHTLSAVVSTTSGDITSAPQTFDLTVSAPNPFFLSPPSQIERAWQNDQAGTVLLPAQVTLSYLVEFPDGYDRPLNEARLYMDGVMIQETTDLTVKQFNWILPVETSAAQHTIQVEVVDSLGLSGKSIALPVQLTIRTISKTKWQLFMERIFTGEHVVILLAVLVSAAALITILVLSSRATASAFQSPAAKRYVIHSPSQCSSG